MKRTVTFTPPLPLDSHKRPIAGPQPATIVDGCVVAPQVRASSTSTGEIRDRAQETGTRALTVYPPPCTDIDLRSTATVEGFDGTWTVDGDTIDWTSGLTGWNPGGELVLRKAGG